MFLSLTALRGVSQGYEKARTRDYKVVHPVVSPRTRSYFLHVPAGVTAERWSRALKWFFLLVSFQLSVETRTFHTVSGV